MTKRWLFIAMSLFLMMAVKHAIAQNVSTVGWALDDDPTHDVAVAMIAAPILGTIFGALRLRSASAFRPMITLSLGTDAAIFGSLRGSRRR